MARSGLWSAHYEETQGASAEGAGRLHAGRAGRRPHEPAPRRKVPRSLSELRHGRRRAAIGSNSDPCQIRPCPPLRRKPLAAEPHLVHVVSRHRLPTRVPTPGRGAGADPSNRSASVAGRSPRSARSFVLVVRARPWARDGRDVVPAQASMMTGMTSGLRRWVRNAQLATARAMSCSSW